MGLIIALTFSGDGINFKGDVSIYGDGNLLYEIENDNIPLGFRKWYMPSKSFSDYNLIKVKTTTKKYTKPNTSIHLDIDPLSEEMWDEDIKEIKSEMTWYIDTFILPFKSKKKVWETQNK